MSKTFLGLLCLTFSLSSLLLKAQADLKGTINHPKFEQTLLWQIEGQGIQTSYVYGTFHILPQSDFEIKDKVHKAFQNSEQIVLEVDMDDPDFQAKMMQNASMKGDTTLSDLFSAENYKQLDQLLQKSMGIPIAAFNTIKPFMLISVLLQYYIEGNPASFEASFLEMATKAQKEILGLETVESQLMLFDNFSYITQAEDVKEMLDDEEKTRGILAKMIALYKAEDVSELHQFTVEYFNTEAENELFLNKRNRAWIPTIGAYAKKKTSFFGVGAAHLGGKQGVLNLLKEAGYTVKPILD